MLGLRLDPYAGHDERAAGEHRGQPVGQRLGRERGRVDPLDRRIEHALDGQVRRCLATSRRALGETAREAVPTAAVRPEPGQHLVVGQRRELAERGDAEADQQIGEVGVAERLDRQRSEERRGLPRRHDLEPVRRLDRGERAVGDPEPGLVTDLGDHAGEHVDQRLLATEVPGRARCLHHGQPRSQDLDARRELLDGRHHRLERARVPSRIGGDDDEVGDARLRLAPTLPPADSLGPGRHRGGDHMVGRDHDRRLDGGDPGRHHRPVRAPERQRPDRPIGRHG